MSKNRATQGKFLSVYVLSGVCVGKRKIHHRDTEAQRYRGSPWDCAPPSREFLARVPPRLCRRRGGTRAGKLRQSVPPSATPSISLCVSVVNLSAPTSARSSAYSNAPRASASASLARKTPRAFRSSHCQRACAMSGHRAEPIWSCASDLGRNSYGACAARSTSKRRRLSPKRAHFRVASTRVRLRSSSASANAAATKPRHCSFRRSMPWSAPLARQTWRAARPHIRPVENYTRARSALSESTTLRPLYARFTPITAAPARTSRRPARARRAV